nr:MAG TPA: hypothetical protein [Caudoviricetes sp.]
MQFIMNKGSRWMNGKGTCKSYYNYSKEKD